MNLVFREDVVLFDTDVLTLFFGDKPEAQPYMSLFSGKIPAISFVMVGEVWRWAYQENWSQRRREHLEQYLDKYVTLSYEEFSIAQRWGLIQTGYNGSPYPVNRAWVAASALALELPLASHNPAIYEGIRGLKLITGSDEDRPPD